MQVVQHEHERDRARAQGRREVGRGASQHRDAETAHVRDEPVVAGCDPGVRGRQHGEQHGGIVVEAVEGHPCDGPILRRGPFGEQGRFAVARGRGDGDHAAVAAAGRLDQRGAAHGARATWRDRELGLEQELVQRRNPGRRPAHVLGHERRWYEIESAAAHARDPRFHVMCWRTLTCGGDGEPADKPDSVGGSLAVTARWPSICAAYLGTSAGPAVPRLALLRVGVASRRGRPRRWCALTAPFHPCLCGPPVSRRPAIGGLLSVALNRQVAPSWLSPAPAPCGVRTFLDPVAGATGPRPPGRLTVTPTLRAPAPDSRGNRFRPGEVEAGVPHVEPIASASRRMEPIASRTCQPRTEPNRRATSGASAGRRGRGGGRCRTRAGRAS